MSNIENEVGGLTPDSPAIISQRDELMVSIYELLNEYGIIPNEVQRQMLESHMKAMVWRSHSGESLPEIDVEMFDEISSLSLTLAEQVCTCLDNLAYEEAHLLSVHFETAKENELSTQGA